MAPGRLSAEIRRDIQATIDSVNKRLERVETVKKFAILPRELSIENGELTGTLKVKRNKVVELYDGEIEALHCGTDWLRSAVLTPWGDAGSACIVGAAARGGSA